MIEKLLALLLAAVMLCGNAFAVASLDGELPDEIETGEGYQNIVPLGMELDTPLTLIGVDTEALKENGSVEAGIFTVTDLGNQIYRITDAVVGYDAGVHVDESGAYLTTNYASDVYLIFGDRFYIIFGCEHAQEDVGAIDIGAITEGREPLALADELALGQVERIDLGGREVTFFGMNGGVIAVDEQTQSVFTADFIGSADGVEADEIQKLWDNLDALSSFIFSSYEAPVFYTSHSWQIPTDFIIDADYFTAIRALLTDVANGNYEALYSVEQNGYDLRIGEGIASIITTRRAALAFTLAMGGDLPSPFADVESYYPYANEIAWCYATGLTNGVGRDTFAPYNGLTRAEFMTFLGRAVGAVNDTALNGGFTDVPAGQWYSGYIAWGVENELIQGVGNNRFEPNGVLTRNHVNIILTRFCDTFDVELENIYETDLNIAATRGEIAYVLYILGTINEG